MSAHEHAAVHPPPQLRDSDPPRGGSGDTATQPARLTMVRTDGGYPRILLIGPFDPHGGEYTFLSPPLGVWRLAGVLQAAGYPAAVFDPNCTPESPQRALSRKLSEGVWDVVGISTTAMTLQFDLELAHLARRIRPRALFVAGGIEATFQPRRMFELGPFDLVVLGEGEGPLLALAGRLRANQPVEGIPGCLSREECANGAVSHRTAMSPAELRAAIFSIPYHDMPYEDYWSRLEAAYRVDALPAKAERESRLAEIRSVRLITLNYCPMGCTFCSATNFLHEAQGGVAAVARLDAQDCIRMIRAIVAAQPRVRTVIFQDDIFAFTRDKRLLELCAAITEEKSRGGIPTDLRFISTNRIDAMNPERLRAMRDAGFRVLGFGIESFSRETLAEFNKAAIFRHIVPVLNEALSLGITPFLDLILASPRGAMADLAETLRQAFYWISRGCEVGIYPYVIPFTGSALARDPALGPHTSRDWRRIFGTSIEWEQASKILPLDPAVRAAILHIEDEFEAQLHAMQRRGLHLPSRTRSLLWIRSAIPVMAESGIEIAEAREVQKKLDAQLPRDLHP